MKIYLASPLFTTKQKNNIKRIVDFLRDSGAEVFSPMEYNMPNAWEVSNNEWAKNIFEHDIEGLQQADAVVCIYEGFESDTGTAWELGYAFASGKKVFVINNNIHEQLNPAVEKNKISLMIAQSAYSMTNLTDKKLFDELHEFIIGGPRKVNYLILNQQ